MKTFLGRRVGLLAGAAALAAALAAPVRAQSAESRPADWREALRAADRLLAQGKYAEAKAAYDVLALEPSPAESTLRYKRAFAAAKTGDLATAGADFDAVAERATGRLAGSALLRRAEVAQRAGQDAVAEDAFSRMGLGHVDHPQAHVALTRILAHIGKAKSTGKPVLPGLVHAAEVLASRDPRSRWRGPSQPAAPAPPPAKSPAAERKPPPPARNPGPAKKPGPQPGKPPGAAKPKPGSGAKPPPPPAKDAPKPRIRPEVPPPSAGDSEVRTTPGI